MKQKQTEASGLRYKWHCPPFLWMWLWSSPFSGAHKPLKGRVHPGSITSHCLGKQTTLIPQPPSPLPPPRPTEGKDQRRRMGWVLSLYHAVTGIRDIKIWQQGRPWKPRWKIDSASFQTISRLSQVARYLKEGILRWSWREGPQPSLRIDDTIYRLAVPVLKKLLNLVISRSSRAGTA